MLLLLLLWLHTSLSGIILNSSSRVTLHLLSLSDLVRGMVPSERELLRDEALPVRVLSFFRREVGVRLRGGEAPAAGPPFLASAAAGTAMLSAVFRREIFISD